MGVSSSSWVPHSWMVFPAGKFSIETQSPAQFFSRNVLKPGDEATVGGWKMGGTPIAGCFFHGKSYKKIVDLGLPV